MKTLKHIAQVTVSTKKGHSQVTSWHVSQSHPFPHIGNRLSSLGWENGEKLVGRHPSDTPTIGTEYRCFLLRSDFNPDTATGNRNDFAGFSPGLSYDGNGNRVHTPAHPGEIVLRGQGLGEMSIVFGNNPQWPDIRRGCSSGGYTVKEREWIQGNICPALSAYIAANAASLKLEAVEALRVHTEKEIREAREQIDKAEKEIRAAISKL